MGWLTRWFRSGGEQAQAALKPAPRSRFRAGQVWRYQARPGEDGSTAIVGKVEETVAGDVIVHVQLDGLNIPNAAAPSGRSSIIHHLPIAEEQLAKSVVELVSNAGAVDGFDEGYGIWRDAYLAGKGGVFALPLAEIVGVMEGTIGGGPRTSGS